MESKFRKVFGFLLSPIIFPLIMLNYVTRIFIILFLWPFSNKLERKELEEDYQL